MKIVRLSFEYLQIKQYIKMEKIIKDFLGTVREYTNQVERTRTQFIDTIYFSNLSNEEKEELYPLIDSLKTVIENYYSIADKIIKR